jgi:predicted PurR-regulated permease PerM
MDFRGPTEKQATLIWFAITAFAVAVTLAIIGVVLWGFGIALRQLSPVLWPLAAAGVLAYLLDPVVDALVTRRVPRVRAIGCVFALALLAVVVVLGNIIPRAVAEGRDLVVKIPTYMEQTQQKVEHWINHPPAPLARWVPPSIRDRLAGYLGETNALATPVDHGVVSDAAGSATNTPGTGTGAAGAGANAGNGRASNLFKKAIASGTSGSGGTWMATIMRQIGDWIFGQVGRVASWFGVIAGIALIPVYTFYFLLEKRGIERQWTDYLPVANSRFKDELVFVISNINDCLIVFFRGQVLVALCDGVLYGLGFLIIGLPYALLIGVMGTFLTMIPFLGAITTCGTALVIALVQYGDWLHPALVLAVFGFVQLMEALVFQPKIIGDRVGLHPMTIIVALMVGTNLLGGVLGGILAIPLTAALRVLMFRYVWKRREASPAADAPGSESAAVSPPQG